MCTNFRGSHAHTRRLRGGANTYPEELRISNSRSLWRPNPVPRWTGGPHQLSARDVQVRMPPYQGPTDKREGNLVRVGRKGRRQNLVLHSPCPAPVPRSSGCLLLGKLSGPGEGLGSFPNSPGWSAGSIPVTASASQSLSVSPESRARKKNPCGTKGPRARCGRVPGVSPSSLAWDPVWGAGTEAPHLLRRVQALPFDGRGHWGGGRRAGRRGRSLCGAWLASCLDSDPLGCSGAAAPAPPLARSLRRRARPSTLKDSHRAPFKRQRERERITQLPGARRPRQGAGEQPGLPPAAATAAAAQDLTFHPGPAAVTTAAAAARSRSRAVAGSARPPRAPRTFAGVGAPRAERGRRPGGGERTARLSPGSLLSREGLFSLSFPLSLVSFPFS